MASGESFNSSAVESNGIRMEIMVPEIMALAIPENQPGAYTPVQLDINISNNTSTDIPINIGGSFIPELVGADGQSLQWQEPTERQLRARDYACSLVRPRETIGFSVEARLIWQNNRLQLQVPDSPDYWQVTHTPEDYWSSAALYPGTYQLRFIYNPPTEAVFCLDSKTGQQRRVEAIETGRLATPFVNLSLVQPIETNRYAVEVESVRFETVMPERVLTLPEKEGEAKTFVRLGIRITNNTTKPLRFNCFNAIIPSMMEVNRGYAMDWLGSPKESDFPLALPGESVTFFPSVSLLRKEDNQYVLILGTEEGGVWEFGTLNSGTYHMQFEYINKNRTPIKIYDPGTKSSKRTEKIWTGLVSLPPVEFSLVAYLIFTLTWFECAQFTHIVWWALSLWGIEDELFTHSSSFMAFYMNHEQ